MSDFWWTLRLLPYLLCANSEGSGSFYKLTECLDHQRKRGCEIFVFFIFQSERDIMIWNNKKYSGKPIFARSKEDSLLARHRRWYSQFYSEHSPRLRFQKDTLDW